MQWITTVYLRVKALLSRRFDSDRATKVDPMLVLRYE